MFVITKPGLWWHFRFGQNWILPVMYVWETETLVVYQAPTRQSQPLFQPFCPGEMQAATTSNERQMMTLPACISVVLLLLVPLLPGGDAGCTNQQSCKNHYDTARRRFWNNFWGLSEIPSSIPSDALWVELMGNEISSVDHEDFVGLQSLIYLGLSINQISSVGDGAFSDLRSLLMLSLMSNKLTSVHSRMFTELHYLQQIMLSSNEISEIEEGSFDDLFSLQKMLLHNNKLATLSADLFINLPRPLELSLSDPDGDTNVWNCSSLCWLKQEMQHGTVTWWFDYSPKCADGGSFKSQQCGDKGQIKHSIQHQMDLWHISSILFFDCNYLAFILSHSGTCPEPGGVPFSSRTRYNGPYNPGSQVTYTCFSGESGTVTCQSSGVWTMKPTCSGDDYAKSLWGKCPVVVRYRHGQPDVPVPTLPPPPTDFVPRGLCLSMDFVPPMYGVYTRQITKSLAWDKTYATLDCALQLPWALLQIWRLWHFPKLSISI